MQSKRRHGQKYQLRVPDCHTCVHICAHTEVCSATSLFISLAPQFPIFLETKQNPWAGFLLEVSTRCYLG